MEQTFIMITPEGVQRGLGRFPIGEIICRFGKKGFTLKGQECCGDGAKDHWSHKPIRGDFAIDIERNVIHGSDSVDSATKEIALWLPDGPVNLQTSLHPWIYESS